MEPLTWLFDAHSWSPRLEALGGDPLVDRGTIGATLVATLSLLVLPAVGALILRRRPHLAPDRRLAAASLVFVALYGVVSAVDALTFWLPVYRLGLVVRVAAAAGSLWLLWRLWAARHVIRAYLSPVEYVRLLNDRDQALCAAQNQVAEAAAEVARRDALRDALRREVEQLLTRIEGRMTLTNLEDTRRKLVAIRAAVGASA